jgi:hypothetical protein
MPLVILDATAYVKCTSTLDADSQALWIAMLSHRCSTKLFREHYDYEYLQRSESR